MTNIYKICLLVLFAVASFKAIAYDLEVDGFYYDINLENMTATLVSGGKTYFGNIDVPETISYKERTFSVTAINGAFDGCSNLTSIRIPNTVTSLWANTFLDCSKLTTVVGAESIKEIGSSCFSGCKSLSSITLSKELTTIDSKAFYDCRSLTRLEIPEKVRTIGNSAFQNCTTLILINIPSNLTVLPNGLFKNCKSLTRVEIPSSVKIIEDEVFSGCEKLESIIIPSNVNEIKNMVFNGCSTLKKVYIEDSDNELLLGYGQEDYPHMFGLFYDTPVEELYLGRNLDYSTSGNDIGRYYYGPAPFQSCDLRKVSIGNSVTKLKSYTFYNCKRLEEIEIPYSVVEIGDYAFSQSSIKAIYFKDGYKDLNFEIQANDKGGCIPHTFEDCDNLKKIYIGRNFVDGRVLSSYYSNPSTFLPTSIEEIEIGNYVYDLTYLTLNNQKISASLSHYPNLKSLRVGYCVSEIPSLSENEKLTNLILNSPVPVKTSAFSNKQYMDLTPVVPTGYTESYKQDEIWANFWSFLEKGNLDESIIYYNGYIYGRIDADNNIGLLKGRKEFNGDIIVPEQITEHGVTYTVASIGEAMKNSTNLISVTLPKSIIKIEPNAFYGCFGLQTVHFGDKLESIGEYSFYRCRNLKILSIPASVTSFGSHAFENSHIEHLIFEDGNSPLDLPPSDRTYEEIKIGYGSKERTIRLGTNRGYFYLTTIDRLYLGRDLTQKPKPSTSSLTRDDDPFFGNSVKIITIGPNVKRIGSNKSSQNYEGYILSNRISFESCQSIDTVISYAATPPLGASFQQSKDGRNVYNYSICLVPASSKELYSKTEGWMEFKRMYTIPVNPESIEMNIDEATLSIGETLQLVVSFYPEDSTERTIHWKSSNEDVASVSSSGSVFGLKAGASTITASCGDAIATCQVTVSENIGVENVIFDSNSTVSVYSLQGFLINVVASVNEINNLPKGIYIFVSKNKKYKIKI